MHLSRSKLRNTPIVFAAECWMTTEASKIIEKVSLIHRWTENSSHFHVFLDRYVLRQRTLFILTLLLPTHYKTSNAPFSSLLPFLPYRTTAIYIQCFVFSLLSLLFASHSTAGPPTAQFRMSRQMSGNTKSHKKVNLISASARKCWIMLRMIRMSLLKFDAISSSTMLLWCRLRSVVSSVA